MNALFYELFDLGGVCVAVVVQIWGSMVSDGTSDVIGLLLEMLVEDYIGR